MIYTITLNPSIDRTLEYPEVVLGKVNRALAVRTDLSGKGVNVSVALTGLGAESIVMGYIAGYTGQVLVEGLCEQGYVCDFCELAAGETRSNITVLDRATGSTTKLNEPGPQINEHDLETLADRLAQRLEPDDICVLSGRLPPGAPADSYARLIHVIHGKGAQAALDTSGEALGEGCRAGPDWLKPNDIEAASLIGRPLESSDGPPALRDAVLAILERGPKRVLLTLGPQGALYADRDEGAGEDVELWWATPPEIDEASNVGAGDASLAGAIHAWQRRFAPRDVVRWAVATGTAAAQEHGSSMASREQVETVLENVSVVRL